MKEYDIKAVFLDFDGTVFSHGTGSVPSSALRAVEILREKGILVFCATGRHILEIRDMHCEHLPFDGWLTLNGALCQAEGETFFSVPLDREDLELLINESSRIPFPLLFLEEDAMYINRDDESVRRDMEKIHTPMPEIRFVNSVPEKEIYMLVPYCSDEIWNSFCGRLKKTKWTRWSSALDVMSKDVGKGTAVQQTLKRYGLRMDQSLAVGDGPNDVELLQACGFSAAMANGDEILKKEADYITDDIDNDGLWKAFVHFGLIQEEI